LTSRPLGPAAADHLIGAAGIDDPLRPDAELLGPHRPVTEPVELARRVRVGVDREPAAGLGGQSQQPVRQAKSKRSGKR